MAAESPSCPRIERKPDYDAFLPGQNCYDPFRAIAVQDLGVAPRMIDPAGRRR